jgi:hypothetical protein
VKISFAFPAIFSFLLLCISCYRPIYDLNLSKAKPVPPLPKTWAPVGAPNFTGGGSTNPTIAISPDGTPFVGFEDGGAGNWASVMYRNGNVWSYLGARGFSPNSAHDTSIAIDSSSQHYLAFVDASTTRLNVYRYSSGVWGALGGFNDFSPDTANQACFSIDSSDVPYAVYQNSTNRATAMRYNGSAWNVIGASFSPGTVSYLSLAVDSAGIPYVGFQDISFGYQATVMRYYLGSWNIVGSQGFSVSGVNYTSIAIDSLGNPYLAYQDGSFVAKVYKFDGSNWVDLGDAASTAGANVYRISLAISKAASSRDTLYLGYSRMITSVPLTYGVSVLRFNGSGWEPLGAPYFFTNSVAPDFVQVAIAPNDGTPYVSIQCNAVTTVMAFR